jgi:hypothetical protein
MQMNVVCFYSEPTNVAASAQIVAEVASTGLANTRWETPLKIFKQHLFAVVHCRKSCAADPTPSRQLRKLQGARRHLATRLYTRPNPLASPRRCK